jgi:hypothetical protein
LEANATMFMLLVKESKALPTRIPFLSFDNVETISFMFMRYVVAIYYAGMLLEMLCTVEVDVDERDAQGMDGQRRVPAERRMVCSTFGLIKAFLFP